MYLSMLRLNKWFAVEFQCRRCTKKLVSNVRIFKKFFMIRSYGMLFASIVKRKKFVFVLQVKESFEYNVKVQWFRMA